MSHRPITVAAIAVLGMLAVAACQTGTEEPIVAGPEPSVIESEQSDEPTDEPTDQPADEPTDEPADEPTDEPTSEAAVNGPNSITEPHAGETVDGPLVTVAGEGTAFEATLVYRVTTAGTEDVVTEGYTMAGANGEIGPYTVELTLDPGEYTVGLWEPDASDGESPDGPYRNLVEVTFTVR